MLAMGSGNNGIAFVVSAGVVYEIIAFSCSSPQTAEINIRKRGDTLMKWVHLGQGLSIALIVVAAVMDRKMAIPIITGGAFGMASAEIFYQYAKQSGYKRPGPETEQY
jgi:hypothetical protein